MNYKNYEYNLNNITNQIFMYDWTFFTNGKQIATQIKIWKIIKSLVYDQEYFKQTNINQISKDYKICKKTLKKYLKHYFVRVKKSKEKRIFIRDKIEIQFFRDLEKINNKYNWFIDNSTIKQGQYYLNNLRQ